MRVPARHVLTPLSLLIAFLSNAGAAFAEEIVPVSELITPATYRDLSALSREVLSRYPPKKAFIVGIGRSPLPIVALLQELSPGSAISLPFSREHRRYDERTLRSYDKVVFDHLERFIPSAATLGGRKIVLVDVTGSAYSLEVAHQFIQRFVSERRPGVRVESLALADPQAPRTQKEADQRDALRRIGARTLSLAKYPALYGPLLGEKFKAYSDYPSFVPWKTPPQALEEHALAPFRARFATLRAEIQKHLEKDPEMARYRSRPFSPQKSSGDPRTLKETFRSKLSRFGMPFRLKQR